MKLGRVRTGKRFVFDQIGGVYLKVSPEKARCIYGSASGNEVSVDPELLVFVLSEDSSFTSDNKGRFSQSTPGSQNQECENCTATESATATPQVMATESVTATAQVEITPVPETETKSMPEPIKACAGNMKIVVVEEDDEDGKVLFEIADATAGQVAAYSAAEGIKLSEKENSRRVMDAYVDHGKQTLCILVSREG